MDGYLTQIALVAVLVILNALFAGSEMALVSLRQGQVRRLETEGTGGQVLARLIRDPNRFLATIQIGITLAGFLASATAAVSLAQPLVPPLSFLGTAAEPVAIVLVTVVLTFITLVFGELAPKRVAMQRAERWALLAARPLNWLATLSRPAVWALGRATDMVVRLAGGNPAETGEEMTPEELREVVTGHRGFTRQQRDIITGAVEIRGRTLREIVVPRRDVFTLDAETPVPRARTALAESGYSRAPVVRHGNLDELVGIVHLRDLLTETGTVASRARPAVLFPESLPVTDALHRFQAERNQFAIVIDERGAADGIVTIEDVLEEIVGEIYDESDRDLATARREPDGSLVVPGGFPVHDLDDLGVDLPDRPPGDYATLAGMLLVVLGHIPERPGEEVRLDGWIAEVLAVEGHAITLVRLRPAS